MKLDTANTLRVAAAYLVVLVIIAVNWPRYGVPLAVIWLGVVVWQLLRENKKSNGAD